MKKRDLIIIGGGPAGYTAALEAAELGLYVRLFESHKLGGTCLHYGCIPTKALLESVNLYSKVKKGNYFGVEVDNANLNVPKIINRKNILVKKLNRALELEFLQFDNIEIINDYISLKEALDYKTRVIIATGTSPKTIPGMVSVNDALDITKIPSKAIILGAGAVGLEFATYFKKIGAKVDVYEKESQILPKVIDDVLAKDMQKILQRKGINFYLNSSYTASEHLEKDVIAVSCIGRQYNNNAFSETSLEISSQGKVFINDFFETNIPDVYAIGDINGASQLAHVAYAQAKILIENLFKTSKLKLNYNLVPFCVFSDPPLAIVGKKKASKTIKIPSSKLGMSQVKSETDGYLCLLLTIDDFIEGVQILGGNAPELISVATLLVGQKYSLDSLRKTIFPHPTMSEIFSLI